MKRKYEQEKAKSPEERRETILAIGHLKTEEAADFLISVFDELPDTGIRQHALRALGACATPSALRRLIKVSEESIDFEERIWALDASVWAEHAEAVKLAFEWLTDRKQAVWLRDKAGLILLKYCPPEKSETMWRIALKDNEGDVRKHALIALASLNDPQVLAVAKTALNEPKNYELRRSAVEPWRVRGGAEAVRVLLKAPIRGDGGMRAAIAAALSTMVDDDSFNALAAGFPDSSAETRAAVASALGKSRRSQSMALLRKLIADESIDVKIAALEAMAERGGDETWEILRAVAQEKDDETAEVAVGLLLGDPRPETVKLLVRTAAQANRPPCRVSALDTLVRIGSVEAFPAFEAGIGAKEWQVRAASIRGLTRVKKKESVDLLIGRLEAELQDRLLGDLLASLRELTGKAIGANPDHWKAWWKAKREGFSFDRILEEDGGAKATTTYHGIPVFSKRIVFLVDVSGSMVQRFGASTRIASAKAELVKVLRELKSDTRVNLIFFNAKVTSWKSRLAPIGPNLTRALESVEEARVGGETNIYDALKEAMEDPDVDTLYLLSDGDPTVGKYVLVDDILKATRRLNRSRQIEVHTISLGKSELLKQLAGDNGGKYQEIK